MKNRMIVGIVIGVAATLMATQAKDVLFPAADAANADTFRQLNLFGDVFERVRSDYVEERPDDKLIKSAISGMLSALDPHSSYLDPKSFRDMQVETSGKFGGLGIEVTMENEAVKVVSPIDDTPAHRAGILAGDLITHLDDEPVKGMNLSDAVERMRGEIGTGILLTIRREGAEEALKIEIVRDEIQIRSVRGSLDEDVGYVRISTFSEQTTDGLEKAVDKIFKEAKDEELKGFVIDLRNNPGGLLEQAVLVSDAFLDRGEIVSTRGRDPQSIQRRNARDGDITKGKPVIVLVNGGSASASEIVAGALQDHQRATILGTRSFGKGSVQTILPVSDGAIRLTTARYFTPSGRSIQAKGIEPDVEVIQELPDELKGKVQKRAESQLSGHLSADKKEKEASGSLAYVPREREKDVQLQRAFSMLRGIGDAKKSDDKEPETEENAPAQAE